LRRFLISLLCSIAIGGCGESQKQKKERGAKELAALSGVFAKREAEREKCFAGAKAAEAKYNQLFSAGMNEKRSAQLAEILLRDADVAKREWKQEEQRTSVCRQEIHQAEAVECKEQGIPEPRCNRAYAKILQAAIEKL